ncbi:MAG: protein phosphatase 2C domain-containing protein [Pseudomonadota bacterium]|nr:protein phosphatase 2C domain-containing protein [Pseudomonadota bacterium]
MDKQIESIISPRVAAGRARGGRPSQQDALICLHDQATDTSLLVLADGMGGDGAGELASEGVIAVARQLWEQGQWREQPGAIFLEALCQQSHTELRRRGRDLASGEPHSTVVALLIRGRRLCWAHVGDSRLYHFQGKRCLGRTQDHSVSQWKVGRRELAADRAGTDPDQHKLLRGLGGLQPPQVDHGGAVVRPGQSFALCSDGVWEQLSIQELGRLASRRDQGDALHWALTLALNRAGQTGDNVALILFRTGWLSWFHRRISRRADMLGPVRV